MVASRDRRTSGAAAPPGGDAPGVVFVVGTGIGRGGTRPGRRLITTSATSTGRSSRASTDGGRQRARHLRRTARSRGPVQHRPARSRRGPAAGLHTKQWSPVVGMSVGTLMSVPPAVVGAQPEPERRPAEPPHEVESTDPPELAPSASGDVLQHGPLRESQPRRGWAPGSKALPTRRRIEECIASSSGAARLMNRTCLLSRSGRRSPPMTAMRKTKENSWRSRSRCRR